MFLSLPWAQAHQTNFLHVPVGGEDKTRSHYIALYLELAVQSKLAPNSRDPPAPVPWVRVWGCDTRPSNTFFWAQLKVSFHKNCHMYVNIVFKTMFQLFKVEAVTYATLLFIVLWQLNSGSPTHWITELYPQPCYCVLPMFMNTHNF